MELSTHAKQAIRRYSLNVPGSFTRFKAWRLSDEICI